MRLIFHGAAQEVGRSCVEVETNRRRFLFDCGLKLGEETEYPTKINRLNKIDAVFLSHTHLDHSGALPLLNSQGLECPIISTTVTRLMTKILLKDSFHIETLSHMPPYLKQNIYNALHLMADRDINKNYDLKEIRYKLVDAGHIAGAASYVVDVDDKVIVYSGDMNNKATRIATAAQIPAKNPDVLILEATYGDREHLPRKEAEKIFLNEIKETLQRGGSALLPTFAIGRAQELILMLDKKFNVPIYLDGMAKDIANIFAQKRCTNNAGAFQNARKRVKNVKNWRDRKEIVQDQGIFITTSGMMDGGPVMDYLKYMYHNPKNSILLTGWQAEGTNGRLLMDQGAVFIDGARFKVKARHKQFDFSAHAGLSELKEYVRAIKPKKIALNHGDPGSVENLAKELRKEGYEVYTPKLNDIINV